MHCMHADIFEADKKGSARQSDGGFTSTGRAKGHRDREVFANSQLEALGAWKQLRELVGPQTIRKDGEHGQAKKDAEKHAHRNPPCIAAVNTRSNSTSLLLMLND